MRAGRLSFALVCSLGLAACSTLMGDVPTVDDALIVAKVQACNGPGDGPKAANDYMEIGFANVYAACEAFFVNATRFQQNAMATSATLDAGLIGATSIINATSSAASAVKAITITTAGITFGKAVLNDYITIYTFGTHLYKVRQLVQNDMDSYATQTGTPADTCIAYANVQKLATKCTLANMQALLDAQVALPSQAVPNSSMRMMTAAPASARFLTTSRAFRSSAPATSSPAISSTVIPVR
jgi:hypothetical protein